MNAPEREKNRFRLHSLSCAAMLSHASISRSYTDVVTPFCMLHYICLPDHDIL